MSTKSQVRKHKRAQLAHRDLLSLREAGEIQPKEKRGGGAHPPPRSLLSVSSQPSLLIANLLRQ